MTDGPQKTAFLEGEGNSWYDRNVDVLQTDMRDAHTDEVAAALIALKRRPRRILEVGCSNGWRLDALRRLSGAECAGLDPSAKAIAKGRSDYPELDLYEGTADSLPFQEASFDAVIFGFCLYLCDRQDLFRIAAEADRVLADRGVMVIYDFYVPRPYRNPYRHRPDLYSYKMDYGRLFEWHPMYTRIYHKTFVQDPRGDLGDPDTWLAVTVLGKDAAAAFPEGAQTA